MCDILRFSGRDWMASALTMNVPIIGFKFFLDAVEVKRLWLGIVGVVQLPPSTIHHLPLATIQCQQDPDASDRARFRL